MIRRSLLLQATLGAALSAVFVPAPSHATGSYYEEPLTTLPDFLKLDLLPAKTFEQIREETQQPLAKVEELDVNKEITAFEEMKGPEVLTRIDQLLRTARSAQNNEALNVLNDLRDLYTGPASAAEIAAYVPWRLGPAPSHSEEIAARLKDAPPALRPHYLYLKGAAHFRARNDVVSKEMFDEILKQFPGHPRAEVALFMSARCELSQSRTGDYTEGEPALHQAQRVKAVQLLEEYLAKYPKGRWAGDALGWLGAWYYDGKDYAAALHCYLRQIDYPDHPELAASALIMCERALSRLASAPHEKAWADVAKHPLAAQALVYLLVNSTESDNYDGKLDPADKVRAWRRKLLPQVAAAIAAQAHLNQDATWRPRYLSTLALASSGLGRHDEALRLLDTAAADAQTDDLLLTRGAVLQRAKRSPEAIRALRTLLEKFPASPLALGARLRLGLALADDHRAGEAILELDHLLEKAPGAPDPPAAYDVLNDTGGYPIYSEVTGNQVRQLIDLWLNFAPIEELVKPAAAPGFDPVQKLRLTEPIAERLLAAEQFDEARKYMTPAQFDLVAGPIEKRTVAMREAKDPAARAAACLALGDAWAAARSQLLAYPLDTEGNRKKVYPDGDDALANVRRKDAAAILGYPGDFRLELENRDELQHALHWWIEAAHGQPGAGMTATALWRALHAMPLIADVSPFTYERARARNWGEVSRQLYDRLRTEFAGSIEAQRYAVFWNFPAPEKHAPNLFARNPGRDPTGFPFDILHALGIEENSRTNGDDSQEIPQLAEVLRLARIDNPEVLKARAGRWRDAARSRNTEPDDARWVNFFDDLESFFSEPETDGEVRQRYVEMRIRFLERCAVGNFYYNPEETAKTGEPDTVLQKDIAAALADPRIKPVADYFEFLNLAVIANHFTFVRWQRIVDGHYTNVYGNVTNKEGDAYRTHNYPLLAMKVRAFLEKYPQSRKREAALLLEARAVYRASEQVALLKPVPVPGARWEGIYVATLTAQEPFEAKRVRETFDAYDRAFPQGRYAGDIRNYRAAVALRLHEWKAALEMTIAQLDDPSRVDLRPDAARRLAALFDQLADERYRADLLPVIKAHPRARNLLLKYITGPSDIHPLYYLAAWLREQAGGPPASIRPKS